MCDSKMQLASFTSGPASHSGSSDSRRSRTALLPALLIGLNLVVLLLLQSHNLAFEKGDFKMFYTAALAVRTGHASELYSRDVHVGLQRSIVPSVPLQDVKVY